MQPVQGGCSRRVHHLHLWHTRVRVFSAPGPHRSHSPGVCWLLFSRRYLAPEILRKRPYGVCVDWWSMGTLLYEMLTGLPPFYDTNRAEMYRKILDAPMNPPPTMSPEAVDLCAKLLVRDPRRRLGYNGGDEVRRHVGVLLPCCAALVQSRTLGRPTDQTAPVLCGVRLGPARACRGEGWLWHRRV